MWTKQMQQIGAIVYGAGLNAREWIDREKAQGHIVRLCAGYCEIYRPIK